MGLAIRPINDADASTYGQIGRKEAREKGSAGDTPGPGRVASPPAPRLLNRPAYLIAW